MNEYFLYYLPMYKKFLLKYKMFANDRWNCFTICIDWKSNEDFESKKMDIINKIKNIPMEAKDFSWNPLYWFWKIPYSVSIL